MELELEHTTFHQLVAQANPQGSLPLLSAAEWDRAKTPNQDEGVEGKGRDHRTSPPLYRNEGVYRYDQADDIILRVGFHGTHDLRPPENRKHTCHLYRTTTKIKRKTKPKQAT